MNPSAPTDIIDSNSGKVRILASRCPTCIFRREGRELFSPDRVDGVIAQHLAAGALLTCHSTLPGAYPDFGPAACAGFWARHGMRTTAGRIARSLIGVTRIAPPRSAEPEAAS